MKDRKPGAQKHRFRRTAALLGIALALSLAIFFGVLGRLDRWVQDALFQRPRALDNRIVIIGIDEDALARLGAYNTWDRNVMAAALEALAADPDRRPAVVAIDTLYAGETDPAADARLAEAAAALGHVVTASSAVFGRQLIDEDGHLAYDPYAVLQYEEPYAALCDVTAQGHINAMYDLDGIMRHALLYVDVDRDGDGAKERVWSMAYETAARYLADRGQTPPLPRTNARGQFYVSYSALPGTYYDGISLAMLIDGEVPAGYFAGKIVLIGPYAAGLQDAYFTPIDRAQQMYGVEYQANVIDALLRGDFKSEVPDLLQAVCLFLLCAVLAHLFFRLRLLPSSILFGAVSALSLALSEALYRAGYLVHPLWIPVGAAVVYLLSIAAHYVRSALEKQQITRTFERYVAPEVVTEILKEGTENLSLGGKLYDIAVLFVDIRGFTTMSEALDPETVVEIINRYLQLTTDCIMRYHGTLDKFVGDCTMAFWNAPFAQEDPVYLACRAAMDMVRGSEEVGRELMARFGRTVSFGVGVNWGPAVVGNIGATQRMDYTAIGDTVNTAARLEANAPGGTVYISRAVADALGDRAETTSLGGTIRLKGKAEGFEILTLDTLK